VHGNDRLNFASNIPAVGPNTFASRDATWIFVVGSPFLVTKLVGDITLITARDILPQVRTMITIYADALSVLRRFMPDVPVEGLTAMVLDPQWLPVGTPPSDGRVVIVIGPLVLHNVTRVDAYDFPMVWDAVLGDLLQLGGSSTAGALPWYARGTAVFIWMYHHCDADAACIADEMSTRGWSSQNGVEMPPALLDLYERGGEDAIAEVLREFRLRPQEFDAMSPEEIFGWLREVTDAQ
jgi:hypothetical protein